MLFRTVRDPGKPSPGPASLPKIWVLAPFHPLPKQLVPFDFCSGPFCQPHLLNKVLSAAAALTI